MLINSCRNTMSDKSIELSLQSTILFTVHDFKQRLTAVFWYFKLLFYSPQFYFTVHNLILQHIYYQHVVRKCYVTVHMCENFYFTVHNSTLQSTISLCSPQFFFTVHNYTFQSTILIYSPYIVNMWLETVILQSI